MKLWVMVALGWLAGGTLVMADDAVDAFDTYVEAKRNHARNLENCGPGPVNTFLSPDEDCRRNYRQWDSVAADSRDRLAVLAAYLVLPPALLAGVVVLRERRERRKSRGTAKKMPERQ